jgi:serine/threonine protein kinase
VPHGVFTRDGRIDAEDGHAAMTDEADLEALLAAVVDYHERHGALPPDLPPAVAAMAVRYLEVTRLLDDGARATGADVWTSPTPESGVLPVIEGFRTIERIGTGGMGEVYKLHDLKLDRVVAGKVIRRDRAGQLSVAMSDFLREAKSLALFSDHRIVQIFEFRLDADPAVIIMEYVDGFELGRLGPSLEFRQKAAVMREVADAVDGANALGIQHRDLKPSNIMLDDELRPKILDFGLSDDRPDRGHLRGTVQYVAPEQLDPVQPIDRRTDVYALGVILYELLCGVTPYRADNTTALLEAVKVGQPRLPIEINPAVPSALQAIALKAMETRPGDRYQTAGEMARDLDRYLAGRPVEARPTQYAQTLAARTRAHLDQIGDWTRLKLIYPHEAAKLTAAYTSLEKREDDWIVASRVLSYSQIVLYLGAFVLLVGSAYYFYARRVVGVAGMPSPLIVLGAPFVGLNLAGRWLYKREHQAVAVAFFLAGVCILPLFLVIAFQDTNLFVAPPDATSQLLAGMSNRQLQITVGLAFIWSTWLAFETKTGALSTVAVVLMCIFALALMADFGLGSWIANQEFDRLSMRLFILIPIYGLMGWLAQRRDHGWFARPSFVAGALMLVVALDLLAANGRMFERFGISVAPLQPANVLTEAVLPTVLALSLNGAIFYIVAAVLSRRTWTYLDGAAQLLFVIAPFSILEPLAYLGGLHAYKPHFDWLYLTLAVAIAIMSHFRQRKSFYYAGLINTGLALYLIAGRYGWDEKRPWSIALVLIGLAGLLTGFWFDTRRRKVR